MRRDGPLPRRKPERGSARSIRGQDLWQVFVDGEGNGNGKSIRAKGQEKRPESQEKGQEGQACDETRGGQDRSRDGGGREARGAQGSQDPQAPARGIVGVKARGTIRKAMRAAATTSRTFISSSETREGPE
jgi:hypothetical protein